MRKVLLFAFILVLAAAVLPAQQTTWISPWATLYPFLPQSMLSFVTSGLFQDQADIGIRSPGQLSDYDGYTFYTMYGNMESWFWTNPLVTQTPMAGVNPFSDNVLTQGGGGGNEFNNILFGAAFPVFDFRSYASGGFSVNEAGQIGGFGTYESSVTNIFDGVTVGTEGERDVTIEDYTDNISGTVARFGVGTDLGFIGVSAFGDFVANSRRTGGTYDFTYTPTIAQMAAPPPANHILSGALDYGSDVDGKVRSFPTGTSTSIGAIGEIVLPLGTPLPIVAGVTVRTVDNGLITNRVPQRAAFTEADSIGSGTETETATLSFLRGSPTTDYPTESDDILVALDGNPLVGFVPVDEVGAFPALDGAQGLLTAPDLDNAGDTTFGIDVHGRVDPEMPIGEVGSVRLRGGVLYSLDTASSNNATVRTMNYTGTTAAAVTSTYAFSETVDAPTTDITNTIGAEVGGVFDFASPSGVIEVAAGLIYSPMLELFTSRSAASTTVTDVLYSRTGSTDVAVWADSATTPLDFTDTGRRVLTATSAEAISLKQTTLTQSFIAPVAVVTKLFGGKVQIVNGYTIKHEIVNVKQTFPDAPPAIAVVDEIFDSATGATLIGAAPVASPASVTDTDGSGSWSFDNTVSSAWEGYMNFMIRLIPFPELTIDIFGQSVMNALDFEWFSGSGYGDLNLDTFISTLGISAIINIK